MSRKARICKALIALLGIGGASASSCDGPVDMYGPAPVDDGENVYRLMYGPAPSSYQNIDNAAPDNGTEKEENRQ